MMALLSKTVDFLRWLRHIGVNGAVSNERRRLIVIGNSMLLILVAFITPFVLFFFSLKFNNLALFLSCTLVSFIGGLICNATGLYKIARFIAIFSSNVTIVYSSCTLGKDSGIHIVLLAMIIAPFALFTLNEKKALSATILFSLFCLVMLEISDYSIFPQSVIVDAGKMRLISYVMMATMLSVTIMIIIVYMHDNYTYETALKGTVKKLEKAEKDLTLALSKAEMAYSLAREDLKKSRNVQENMSRQSAYALLVRNICHELKNPINMIMMGMQGVLSNLDDREKTQAACRLSLRNVERLNTTLKTMLQFGTTGSGDMDTVSINKIVESVALLSVPFFKRHGIELSMVLGDLPDICANENQIQQILLNLLVNAAESMEEKGGKITIVTDPSQFVDYATGETVTSVRIQVRDMGCGIPQENLDTIFDPYFTTKHGNSGLGLAMIMKYVSFHCGTIRVVSEVGKGTTFTLHLPVKRRSSGMSSPDSTSLKPIESVEV